MLFRNENGLREFAVRQTNKVAARAVGGVESTVNGRKMNVPFRRQRSAQRLRQICHQLEIVKPSLGDRLADLSRPKRWLKHFSQFGAFVIEEEFHTASGGLANA